VAVRIRLKRLGRRHAPTYRVTVVDGRRARDSKVIEEVGSYAPTARGDAEQLVLNKDRIEYWLGVGAQPSDTVRRLLELQGVAKPQPA